jgi:hypothetical protein
MTALRSTRGCRGDYRARPFFPLSGRQGAHSRDVMCVGKERPVDTIAGARRLAEKQLTERQLAEKQR